MNIDNLNKLIAHMEAQPPKRINMGNLCGTVCCIQGHTVVLMNLAHLWGIDRKFEDFLGIDQFARLALTMPEGWYEEHKKVLRYPAYRVIATLKRLRDTYLSTGRVVVDWGPEPGEEPKQAWTAPQVAEVIAPALPAELTSLLRNTVEA